MESKSPRSHIRSTERNLLPDRVAGGRPAREERGVRRRSCLIVEASEVDALNSSCIIRRASPDDAAAVAEIYNQGIRRRIATFQTEERTPEERRRWIEAHGGRHPVLVAEVDGRVVGWASLSAYRARACYDGIGEHSVYVHEAYQGCGVGRRLLAALIREAAELGYWKLVSRIFTFNEPSRAAHRACGFREVGVYEKHARLDGRWLDVVIVERLIEQNLS